MQSHERATNLSKLEVFNLRATFDRPTSIVENDLADISFYAFWRLYYLNGQRLVRRRTERFLALNGTGWPPQARRSHPQHVPYAQKTLYAYMPCAGTRGTDYIDDAVRLYFGGSWPKALHAFVSDESNKWCPTWIRRNYEVCNHEDSADGAVLEKRIANFPKFVFADAADPAEPKPSAANPTEEPSIALSLIHI